MFEFKYILYIYSSLNLISSISSQKSAIQVPFSYPNLKYENYEKSILEALKKYQYLQQHATLPETKEDINNEFNQINWDKILNPRCSCDSKTSIQPYKYDNIGNGVKALNSLDIPNIINNYYVLPIEYNEEGQIVTSKERAKRNKKTDKKTKQQQDRKDIKKKKSKRKKKKKPESAIEVCEDKSGIKEKSKKKKNNLSIKRDSEVNEIDLKPNTENNSDKNSENGRKKRKKKKKKKKEEHLSDNISLDEKEKLIDFDEFNKAMGKKENRKIRNSKSGKTTEYQTNYSQDDFNKYLQSLMYTDLMKNQYYLNNAFPYNFEAYKPQSYPATQQQAKKKNSTKRRKSQKSNKTKPSTKTEENCDKVVELTPSIIITDDSTQTQPNKDLHVNLSMKKNILPSDDFDLTQYNDDDVYLEIINGIEELIPHNSLWITFDESEEDDDEYYPDFTLDNGAYLTSSEEEEWNDFHKSSYFLENFGHWKSYSDLISARDNRKNNVNEDKRINNGLDSPDFRTNAVNKDKHEVVYRHCDNKHNDIETVYAPSRVVNYNKPDKILSYTKDNNEVLKDGDTTIVLSKAMKQ